MNSVERIGSFERCFSSAMTLIPKTLDLRLQNLLQEEVSIGVDSDASFRIYFCHCHPRTFSFEGSSIFFAVVLNGTAEDVCRTVCILSFLCANVNNGFSIFNRKVQFLAASSQIERRFRHSNTL